LKRNNLKIYLSLLFFVFELTAFVNISASQAPIRKVTGTVTKVSDGDTIHLRTPEQTKLRVRLYGIDAPETPKVKAHSGQVNKQGQPYCKESWQALAGKIMGRQVRLDILDVDKHRRMVGMIRLDERNINLEMVREGFAEAFVEYLKPPYKSEFIQAEQEAKSSRKGIWSLIDYERPKDFRKRLKISGGE
jgi:endonuclease YncB( thermonuclease family)